MIGVNLSNLFSFILALVNFCDITYQLVKVNANKTVNKALDGYVIYYALYSKGDKYCAILYDYRSFWQRVYLVFLKMIWLHVFQQDYIQSARIFKYENVVENVDNLSSFFVDCAVISYVQDEQVHHEWLTSEASETSTSDLPSFVFAVFNDGTSDYDFTKWFNLYKKGILGTKQLACIDIMIVLCKVSGYNVIDLSDFTLKCMTDNTFDEIVFKENDTISTKIASQ
jgi:hypothetical protein